MSMKREQTEEKMLQTLDEERLCRLLGALLADEALVDVGDDTCVKVKREGNTVRARVRIVVWKTSYLLSSAQ